MVTRGQIEEYKAILEIRNIPFRMECATNHDQLVYEVSGTSYFITIPRGHGEGDPRGHKNNIADILRKVKHIPIIVKTNGNGKSPITASDSEQQELTIKFGVRSNGYLSVSFKEKEISRKFNILPRATLKRTTSGLIIIQFHQDIHTGILPAVNRETVSYTFSRKSVPFDYTTSQIYGKSTPEIKAKFIGNNELITNTPLPTSILATPQHKKEPKAEETFDFSFSGDLHDDGKAIKDLFNEWLRRVKQNGSSADVKFDDNQIDIFVTFKI